MAHIDFEYNKLVKTVLRDGFNYFDSSRGNIKMLQIPSYQLHINMLEGFPLLTTKKIYWKAFAHELIWMLSGQTNIDYLVENGVSIWNKDAANYSDNGREVGRIYGAQWRKWMGPAFIEYGSFNNGLDQIKELILGLKNNFYNRRHIVTAWNPAELDQMALPPCHWSFEIIPEKHGFMLKWHQRSCDLMLGIPFDIGLYALLGKLIEKEIKVPFISLVGDLSNVHFYEPHIKLAEMQITREPSLLRTDIIIKPNTSIFNLSIEDLDMSHYWSHLPIKAELYTKIN